MRELDHPFMPRLYATFRDASYIYLLTDYYSGGDLLGMTNAHFPLSCDAVQFYAANVVVIFDYLHHRHIVFRDLKLENVMIDAHGYLNVIDFGLAKVLPPEGRTYTICGTPMYIAPEVIQKKGHGGEADWWTLGVLVYEMMMGFTPFSSEGDVDSARQLFRNICDPTYTYPFSSSVNPRARSFVRQLLQHSPAARIGFQMFNDAIFIKQHELFDGFDWVGLLQRRLPPPFPAEAPLGDTNRRASVTNGFSLNVQKTAAPYKPEVMTAGCALCPSKYEAEVWHDVFAGDL
jgi:serine/threonine protein kinase